jgi:hypothetical protein
MDFNFVVPTDPTTLAALTGDADNYYAAFKLTADGANPGPLRCSQNPIESATDGDLVPPGKSWGEGLVNPLIGTNVSPAAIYVVAPALAPIAGGVLGATNANPTVITVASTAKLPAQVAIVGVGGNTGADGTWPVTKLDATTFSIPVDTSAGSAFTGGGTVTPLCSAGYTGE